MNDPIYFAQVREDAEIERAVVARNGASRILTIASGGCTALSLLSDAAESIAAVDVSAAQCALVELRRAALVALSRERHLAFIGETSSTDRVRVYYDTLRAHLPTFAQSYWDERIDAIAQGINRAGVTERFYRFLGDNLRRSVSSEGTWQKLFDRGNNLGAQVALFKRHFDNDSFRLALRVLLSKTTHLEFFPHTMFAQVDEHHFGDFFWERLRDALSKRLQYDNYFLHQVIFGSYLLDRPRGTPRYLSVAGYEEARRNARKLSVHVSSLGEMLPTQRGLDAVLLSNVFDWAPGTQDQIAEQAVSSLARDGTILYRNMLADPPLPEPVRQCTRIDEEWSRVLCASDRSLLYRRVVVATRSR